MLKEHANAVRKKEDKQSINSLDQTRNHVARYVDALMLKSYKLDTPYIETDDFIDAH